MENARTKASTPRGTKLTAAMSFDFKGGPEPSKKKIHKVLFPIGRFHF